MNNLRKVAVLIAIGSLVMTLHAAAQAPQEFDVASIKPIAPPIPTGGGPWIIAHGQFRAEVGYVRGMVSFAYNVMPAQVKGGPDWLDHEPYFVDARAEDSQAGPDQIRPMMLALLKDRFKLSVHRETQQAPVYKLTVAKGGSKLQDAKGGVKNFINWTGPGRVTFYENSTLLGLLNILGQVLGSPVIDETGIKGSYNFSLEYTDPRDLRPRNADSPPDLIAAVREQLGLELQSTKGPVEVVVIDHMERPTPN